MLLVLLKLVPNVRTGDEQLYLPRVHQSDRAVCINCWRPRGRRRCKEDRCAVAQECLLASRLIDVDVEHNGYLMDGPAGSSLTSAMNRSLPMVTSKSGYG